MSQPDHDHGTAPNNTNIAWLYERCAKVRTVRMTPLDLASEVLNAIKSFEGDAQLSIEEDMPYILFKVFSTARERKDMPFVFEVAARALQIHGDPDATEARLREFHGAIAGTGDTSEERPVDHYDGREETSTRQAAASSGQSIPHEETAERPGSSGGRLAGFFSTVASAAAYFSPNKRRRVEAPAAASEPSVDPAVRASYDETIAPLLGGDGGSAPAITQDLKASIKGLPDLSDDELCFQLRTRVLGLSLPTFGGECWRYLQMAGWTYSAGQYYIPKGKSCGDDEYLDTLAVMRGIFDMSDLDGESDEQLQEPTSEPDEEGPAVFRSANELVDYLDEFAMPDYRDSTAEVEAREKVNDARSPGYRRRNLRLRFALLQIAYRERNKGSKQGRKKAGTTSTTSRAASSKSRNGTAKRSSVSTARAQETRRSTRLAMNLAEGSADAMSSNKAEDFNEADQYFTRKQPTKKKARKGDIPLAGDIPSADLKPAGNDIVVPTIKECVREVRAMHDASGADEAFYEHEAANFHEKFPEWSFYMATKQSILLYGLGSKRELMASFSDFLADEGDVISLDGYDPSVNLNEFMDVFTQLFCNSETIGGASMADRATACARRYAALKTRPLHVLINNIDGTAMRSHLVQETLANLTHYSDKDGAPMIRIAASVDDVSASLYLWKPQIDAKFDWVSRGLFTYRFSRNVFSPMSVRSPGEMWIRSDHTSRRCSPFLNITPKRNRRRSRQNTSRLPHPLLQCCNASPRGIRKCCKCSRGSRTPACPSRRATLP